MSRSSAPPGPAAAPATAKSGFDRGGYTGYNIRGMESNRVGIDVDGIAQPNATGRGYVGRAGLNTFGIGRDYIDPYMYGSVDIQSGATSTETANSAIGEMSPSARNRRMITCARARPAPSATAAVTTLRIAAGTTG